MLEKYPKKMTWKISLPLVVAFKNSGRDTQSHLNQSEENLQMLKWYRIQNK